MLTPGGFLLPMKYQKNTVTIREQIALMRERGLIVTDENSVERYLKFTGYFRLAGYALPFQRDYNRDGTHTFLPNVQFSDILDLYNFDRELRLLVIDAIERAEVAVKATIIQLMSEKRGPHWYLRPDSFITSFKFEDFLKHVKTDVGHDNSRVSGRQAYIKHYYEKYSDPELPPSWMVFEVLSLGSVSKIFKNLTRENQKPIAQIYKLDASLFASWLHSLSYLRNLAAHHQRLWNRKYTIKPAVAKKLASELRSQDRFYAQAVVIQFLLETISSESNWKHNLSTLFSRYRSVDINRMGFPVDWISRDLWN